MHWFWRMTICVCVGAALFEAFDLLYPVQLSVPYRPYAGAPQGMGTLRVPVWLAVFGQILARDVPILVAALGIYVLLARREARQGELRETRCRRCGYILRGLSEPRCPECGERI